MNRLFLFCLTSIGLCLVGCLSNRKKDDGAKEIEFSQSLADELKSMAEVDQIAAYIPQGKYRHLTPEQWQDFKDSVFTTHQLRLEQILEEHGYPGYDLVGEVGSNNFWLMVQHSDHDIEFQLRVLEMLKQEVDKKNADGSNYGLLMDRVRINKGERQIYGTQVTYNSWGQAFPMSLVDSINVNKRRAEVGLEPIEEYLNMMTLMHFEMNKDHLKAKRINEPRLYTVDSTAEKGMSKKYFPGTGIEKLKKWKELASTNTKWDLAI